MNKLEDLESDLTSEQPQSPAGGMAGPWASFVAAAQFLTRIPIATATPVSPAALQRSPIFFPVVGALIGMVTVLAIAAGMFVWPISLAVIVALALEMWLTGALHEDGVADFCDAFGGGWTREQVLLILKDSRVGTYGVLGLLVAVSLRAAATIEIVTRHSVPQDSDLKNLLMWASVIVAASTMGRWVTVVAMYIVPPVPRRESLVQQVAPRLRAADLSAASIVAAPLVIWFACLHPLRCFLAILILVPAMWLFLVWVQRRLGGVTGDCLGCISYVAQLVVLLAAAMRDISLNLSWSWSNFS